MALPPARVHPSNRRVPVVVRPHHVEHVRGLLHQGTTWVQREAWARWLETGDEALGRPVATMGRDERIAARAWVQQQQHVLHGLVVGPRRAPDGWVDGLPLVTALAVA